MNLKSYLNHKYEVIEGSKKRIRDEGSGLAYLLNRAEDEDSKMEIMKDLSWVQQELIIENNIKSENMYWMMNDAVSEKPNFSEYDASKLHLLELVYNTVKEDGPVMDWEIVEKTQKPLFRIQHALRLLYGLPEICPYKQIGEKCAQVPKRYINKDIIMSENEEFEKYKLKKKKINAAVHPTVQHQLP